MVSKNKKPAGLIDRRAEECLLFSESLCTPQRARIDAVMMMATMGVLSHSVEAG
jgi:hypothetical protein